MRRWALAIAAIGTACAIGAGAGTSARAGGAPAPACIPATLDRSARLPGTQLLVTPAPGGLDAMP